MHYVVGFRLVSVYNIAVDWHCVKLCVQCEFGLQISWQCGLALTNWSRSMNLLSAGPS